MSSFKNSTGVLKKQLQNKLQKWLYILVYSIRVNFVYRTNSIMWMASLVLIILGSLLVWYISYSEAGIIENSFGLIFTYYVIGNAFVFDTEIDILIAEDIQNGSLSNKLLYPTSTIFTYIVRIFGYQLLQNITKFLVFTILGLMFIDYIIFSSDLLNIAVFILLIIIGYLISTMIGIIVACLAFWLIAFYGTASFLSHLRILLSGRLFPLNALKGFGFLSFTPFAFIYYLPVQIYLGSYNNFQLLFVFLGSLFWLVLLAYLANILFRKGLNRYHSIMM